MAQNQKAKTALDSLGPAKFSFEFPVTYYTGRLSRWSTTWKGRQ